jgi:hypothetical protein
MGQFELYYSAGPNERRWQVCVDCYKKHIEGKLNLKDDSIFDPER